MSGRKKQSICPIGDQAAWHAHRIFGNKEKPEMMNIGYHGLWGLLVLAGDAWAIINIFQSSTSNEKKLLWILVVVLLPLVGLILWFFLGPRDRKL